MSEWTETTLGEIASFQNGYPFKPAELTGSGTPVIRIKQLLDPDAEVDLSDADVPHRFHIRDGDLIFSWSGTLAAVLWNRGEAFLNQHLFKVTERPDVDRGWLFFALDHAVEELNRKTHGTTMKHVTKRVLEAHVVGLPPLTEQRRIVDVMAAVDGQIRSLRAEVEALSSLYENGVGLLWQEEDGSEAEAQPLSQVMSLNIERVSLEPSHQYRLAGVLNAGQGMIDKGSFLGIETEYSAMNRLRAKQVVMRKLTAWEGPITVVPDEFEGFVASNEFPTFSLREAASPEWMRHVCRTSRLWSEMRNRVTGSVQRRKRLSPEQLLAVELPIPSLATQVRVSAGLDALLEQRALIATEAEMLSGFRSALLASLLSQTISLPESYDMLVEVS